MASIPVLIDQLAQLSVSHGQGDINGSNTNRRRIEAELARVCSESSADAWLPWFLGASTSGDHASENAQRLAGVRGGTDGALSLASCEAGPTPQSFVAASFLVDFLQKQKKSAQKNESPYEACAVGRVCSLLFEIAAVAAASQSPSFPKPLLHWVRKLSALLTYLLNNKSTELFTTAFRALTEFVSFCFDFHTSDISAACHSLPFTVTDTTAAALQSLSHAAAGGLTLRSCLLVTSITALHVATKTATEKKLFQRTLKSMKVGIIAPALINGGWMEGLFDPTSPAATMHGMLCFNALALAKVSAAKLTASVLKVILSAKDFTTSTPTSTIFSSPRISTIYSSRLTSANVSNFIISGLGAMLGRFATEELPVIVAAATTNLASGGLPNLPDPLAVRTSYFILKAFNKAFTDSFDGAEGAWTTVIPPSVCASSIVNAIFTIIMTLPSAATCAAAAQAARVGTITFPQTSSCPDFDLVASFEKLFLLCAGSVQHICSMEESAEYYAAVLRLVFPADQSASSLALASSVVRRILVEYLREDNSVREAYGEGADYQTKLLARWQNEPERHFEELELLTDGDTCEGAAEQLFTALTGCRSCVVAETGKALFPEAAWSVVNEMLQFNASSSEASRDKELAKLMAYRAIGLGCYTLSEGQEENYKSFFYNSLLPEMRNDTTPMVQRRALWCVGMWCEAASSEMCADFFKSVAMLLSHSGSTMNPVILLTALKALEHFINDLGFDATLLPDGFVYMLFGGLRALFPSLRSPSVIQSVSGLVHSLVSKCGAIDGIGNVMFEMLTPTIGRFVTDIVEGVADGAGADSTNVDDNDWGDEGDDETGATVAAIRIVLETLMTATHASSSDEAKWSSPMTQPLLSLLRLLTDPFNQQGTSGHYQAMLEDDAWAMWGAMVRTTSVDYLGSHPEVVAMFLQMASYAFAAEMAERDFESKAIYMRYLLALWLLVESFAASGGTGEGVDAFLHAARTFNQSFAEQTIAEAMSTADDELLLVGIQTATILTVLPATSAACAPVFMATASNYLFNSGDSDLEGNAASPAMLGLLSYTMPRCVHPGTQSPSSLADRVNAIADVTTSQYLLIRIVTLAQQCVQGLVALSPTDASTFVAVTESCSSQLQSSCDTAMPGSPMQVTGEIIAEAFGDDSRSTHHTVRLLQLLQ